MSQEVTDLSLERSNMLSTIIQFLILGVMTWVGTNIHAVKNDIAEMKTNDAVQARELIYINEKLITHIQNPNAHHIEGVKK